MSDDSCDTDLAQWVAERQSRGALVTGNGQIRRVSERDPCYSTEKAIESAQRQRILGTKSAASRLHSAKTPARLELFAISLRAFVNCLIISLKPKIINFEQFDCERTVFENSLFSE